MVGKKKNNQLITEFEIESKLNTLVEGQTNNSKQLKAIRDYLQKALSNWHYTTKNYWN